MSIFAKKEADQATTADGRPFACTVCGHDRFLRRQAQLNTAAATFFNVDWANRSAECLVCEKCRYVHWFLPE